MRITMPRGDIRLIRFQVRDEEGSLTNVDFDEIYFTVKKRYSDATYLFQKRLTTGGIMKLAQGDYQIKIVPEDTDGLQINRNEEYYDFDIQICYQDQVKETFVGEFVLTKEVTHASNEGS